MFEFRPKHFMNILGIMFLIITMLTYDGVNLVATAIGLCGAGFGISMGTIFDAHDEILKLEGEIERIEDNLQTISTYLFGGVDEN